MRNLVLLFVSFILGISYCFGQTEVQAFHYDTIPNSTQKQSQDPLFKLEQPEKQQPQQPLQRKSLPKSKSSSNQGYMTFGGSFGMSFGRDYSSINISPQIGYQFNPYLGMGGGISYFYSDDHDYSQNYLGLNAFLKVNPVRFITLQVQPEIYQMWGSFRGMSLDSKTVPCILVGGGINIPTGKRGAITTMIYYDLLQDDWSPYGSQIFYSIGYVFGF